MPEVAALTASPTPATGAVLVACPDLSHQLPAVQVQQHWRRLQAAMAELEVEPLQRLTAPLGVSAANAQQLLAAARQLLQRLQGQSGLATHLGLHLLADANHPSAAELQLAERVARRAPIGTLGLSAELADALDRVWELPLVDLGADPLEGGDGQSLKVLALAPGAQEGRPDPVALRDVLVVLRPQLGGNDAQRAAACADLLVDTLTGSLARSALLRVVARESAARLSDPARALQDAFSVLGASHVLSGRGQLGDSGVLSLQLELLARGQARALWSDRITLRVDDLLAGKADSLMRAIADAHAALMSETLSIAQLPAWQSLEDHQLLIGASQFMHRLSPASFERSRLLLEGLRERAPQQALVHAWLAKWHAMAAAQAIEPVPAAAAAATEAVSLALKHDPNCAMAHVFGGVARVMQRAPLEESGPWFRRALDANPNEALAWMYEAVQAVWEDRAEAAESAVRTALAISPLDPWRYFLDSAAAHVYLANGAWEEGLRFALSSVRLRARHAPILLFLVIAHARLGRLDIAHQYLGQLLELWPRYTLTRFWESYPGRKAAHAQDFAWALTAAGLPN